MISSIRAAGAAIALTLVCLAAPDAGAQSVKFGFVDGNQLLQGAPGRSQAEQMFSTEKTAFETAVNKMGDAFRAMEKKFRDEEAGLSPAVRTTRQKQLQDTLEAMQRKTDSVQAVASRRQQELLQPIIDLVNRVLNTTLREGGFTAIFDLSAQGNPIVAYDKNLDLTDEILKKVRAQPAPTLPAASTTATKPPPPATKPPPPAPYELN